MSRLQPRRIGEKVLAVLPVLDLISTGEVIRRVADRFNEDGVPSIEFQEKITGSVESALYRLYKSGAITRVRSKSSFVYEYKRGLAAALSASNPPDSPSATARELREPREGDWTPPSASSDNLPEVPPPAVDCQPAGELVPTDDELVCQRCGRPWVLHGINCPSLSRGAA